MITPTPISHSGRVMIQMTTKISSAIRALSRLPKNPPRAGAHQVRVVALRYQADQRRHREQRGDQQGGEEDSRDEQQQMQHPLDAVGDPARLHALEPELDADRVESLGDPAGEGAPESDAQRQPQQAGSQDRPEHDPQHAEAEQVAQGTRQCVEHGRHAPPPAGRWADFGRNTAIVSGRVSR
jgi:hypothetical protein